MNTRLVEGRLGKGGPGKDNDSKERATCVAGSHGQVQGGCWPKQRGKGIFKETEKNDRPQGIKFECENKADPVSIKEREKKKRSGNS